MRNTVRRNYRPASEPARGLIQREESLQHYKLTRYLPTEDMAKFVENFWVARWDLTGAEPYLQGNLPHPCQTIIIDPNLRSGIFGVQTGKYIYAFQGEGRIFGVRFWPGAFHTFYKQPVKELSDHSIPIANIFSVDDRQLEGELLDATSFPDMAERVENMLRSKTPELDSRSIQVRGIVEHIEANRDIVSASHLAEIFEMTPRTLQRLFDTYIGVSPKWTIDRYRMLEAMAALDNNTRVNIAKLANQLGYFDQAHFTRAFTKLVGYPPSRYNLN